MARIVTEKFSEDIIMETSRGNKDKVIHSDLKETEFDDVVMSVIHPESNSLAYSIKHNSITLTEKTEHEITEAADVAVIDQLLRISFWDEVNTAVVEGRVVSERNIFKGVCSRQYWTRVRDELPEKMAYVLCPLIAYSKANKLGMQLGQRAMLNILNANVVDDKGRTNTKLAQLQFAVFKELQDRMFGKSVQRVQSHNTNETITASESVEDLQKEIELLEAKPLPFNIEATTIEMNNE